jgi:hypothetical protein
LATPAPGFFVKRSEFDEFLFAPIGDEENGMTLSVISALARLGFDPWREAARLAGLPKPQAAAALAGLFGRLPSPAEQLAGVGHAARLIDLLPSAAVEAAARPTRVVVAARWRLPPLGFAGICLMLVLAAIAITLASQSVFGRDERPSVSISARP